MFLLIFLDAEEHTKVTKGNGGVGGFWPDKELVLLLPEFEECLL
jgi:hypothetical protein